MDKYILGIESSCDETSCSIVRAGKVISNVVSTQLFHAKFGGVIPELASRAHIEYIAPICKEALKRADITMEDISAIAVTVEPGLVGSLIVGSSFAKGLALRYKLPIIPINHIEGHLFSGCISDREIKFPFIALVVSGGHTNLFFVESFNKYSLIGATRDDAAGEAFDKIATLMGLPYPGGPEIDKRAKLGDPKKYDFPRSMIGSGDYEFSFSGLKTSVRYFLAKEFPNGIPDEEIPHICASLQEAIVDVLVKKSIRAALDYKAKEIYIAGGVSANSRLREKMKTEAAKRRIESFAPEMSLCIDNAGMIGYIADKKLMDADLNEFHNLEFTVSPSAVRARKKRA